MVSCVYLGVNKCPLTIANEIIKLTGLNRSRGRKKGDRSGLVVYGNNLSKVQDFFVLCHAIHRWRLERRGSDRVAHLH